MKTKDLKLKPESEMRTLLAEKRNQLGVIRFDSMKKIKDTSEIDKLKKDIARILTVLNNKSNI